MAYFEGRFVMVTSPAVGRWLEATTNLWFQKYREAGCPEGPPPEWMFTVQSELHALGTDGNQTVSEKGRSGSLTVNETAKRLQVSRQMVTRYCRQGLRRPAPPPVRRSAVRRLGKRPDWPRTFPGSGRCRNTAACLRVAAGAPIGPSRAAHRVLQPGCRRHARVVVSILLRGRRPSLCPCDFSFGGDDRRRPVQ